MRRLAPVWLAAAAAIPAFAASRTAPATAPRAPLGPETPLARAYLDRLARYTRYALPQVRDWPGAAGCRYHKRDGHRELDVRQNASVALAFAVLARYGEGVSIPRDDVARDARGIIRYLAATHRTGTLPAGDGEPWGDAWQSAFWAGLAGHAAWIIWEDLDDETRIRAARMVAHEADRFLDRPPDDGFRGDTKAEENAWNSIALALAACMFPDDPLAARRRERAIVYMMNAFSEPGDRTDATIVDGRPVRAWVTTTCLYPDHTLENHGRVHPDYLTTFSLNLRNALLYRMAGLDVPRAAFHHAGDAFGVLKRLASPSGGLFYINGQDWWPHRNELALVTGAFMSVLAGDREGAFLERSSLDRLGLLHSRFEDGRLWDPREYNYSEGEEEMMARYAELYLLHRLFGDGPEPVSEAAFESAQGGIRIFEVGGFAIDRTADRLASFAWRNGAMGLVYPGGDTWFTAPWERGIVGRIEVEGAKDDAPAVRSHAARADAGALVVSADIGRCEGRVRQSIAFVALPEGPVIAIERLAAASPCVLRRALTGSLGILNEPAGAVHGNARTIAHEGARFTVTGACDDPDREIPIASRWVLIDDRFGVIALGGERMLYVDANRFERARLREELHASAVAGPRRLAAGEVFRDGATVILSGVDGARIRAALDAWRFERAGEDAARIRGPGWTIDVRYGEGAPAVSIGRGGDGGAEVRIEKLWEGRQRIEGRPVGAGALVLLPCGLHLVALDARTGDEVWRYPFEEDRAGLLVPMGIQGVGYAPLRQGRGIAIAIGSTEIH
ncbi:MAG: hypothetical protein JXP34_15240, partial [Planctomycetes bacterium]|nr:hypothetical protein [Planctomycetota bacterium]